MRRNNPSKQSGKIHIVNPEEEKGRGVGRICKGIFLKSGMKE